jgi:signal transduction histidine kinase
VIPLEAFRQRKIIVGRDTRLPLLPYVSSPEAREYLVSAPWNVVYGVPLIFRGRALGALTCYYEREPEPEEELLPFLQAVADQAALLVESARLTDELRGKAVLEERQRIAHELHDSVTQALYGIGLGADAALAQLEQGQTESLKGALTYLSSLAKAGMAEMRSLLFELRPETLHGEGLMALLERQVSALEPRHGLKVVANLIEPSLEWEAKHALYRVVQEALGNIAKHAAATRVELDMTERDGWLRVRIHDNGKGFQTGEPHPGHFGLPTMRERMHGLGGRLTLNSQPGDGTTVLAELPLLVQR